MSARLPRPDRTAGGSARNRRRFRTAAGVLTASLLLTATACGGAEDGLAQGAEGDGTGTITFWDNNAGPDRTPVWEHIIAEFEEANPDIDVEYVGVPIAQVQQKYDTAIAAGGLPDVGGVGTAYLAGLTAQNALEPLDDRIAGSALEGKFVTGFEQIVRGSGNGEELYAVPTSANAGTLWYRTDLFEEAGLRAPETWEDFYAAAEQLTDKDRGRYGFTIRGGAGSIAQALDAMYAQSGIDTFWGGDTTTVNDPANVAALERFVALYGEQTPTADLNNDSTKMIAQFDGGDIGMLQHNLASYTNHEEAFGAENIAGVPLPPSAPGAPRTIVSNPVDGLGLFRTSENKAAAWKFIEFAASHEMNSYWNEQVAAIPANTDAVDDEWFQAADAAHAAFEAFDDPNTKIVQLPYYLPEWNSLSKAELEPDFQRVLLGEMTCQEFLDKFAAGLNEAQARWRERQGG
ncbi:ABC transporter substrate-binding protein [Allostreptomyces psammosilenae]|uniref:Multiple sugar transport system substrate-binding protein n=1 Tax=Allostreptomyces psammosilenae TaxID=1892865 RepID=A0A852ZWU0_9ACTN|nr:sugar ABC transporter substrate-binding protein [Allostreptomyces psammosilenae]NYI06836.1 multiple sugar transport system substrate-binding protein [Allostreptomyces psammosilenae]